MSANASITPEVLRWARETAGYTVTEVSAKLNAKRVTPSVIESWEQGNAQPTYAQLEQLAYRVYKRPLALFFFPTPPLEATIKQSFRTLPESELQGIPSRLYFLLRKAKVLQLNLMDLYLGKNPSSHNIVQYLHYSPNVDVGKLARAVREYLGIEFAQQPTWESADAALRYWRGVVEEHGVFVFKDSFNAQGSKQNNAAVSQISGFCLYDDVFPIIYINNNQAKTRQIFTLFHELAHLLMHTGGVDMRHDDYIERLTGTDRRIEVLCNQFAAEFLLPDADFSIQAAAAPINDSTISTWAERYQVSREVILRRLLDGQRVSREYYAAKVNEWYAQSKQGGAGGNYYLTKGSYLGMKYIETVFSRHHQGQISVEQVADYLGEKVANVAGIEALLFKGMQV